MTGSPAPVTGVVSGLTNGSAYTFTVTATNSVGTGRDSSPSNAVTPSASPQFVQRVSGRTAATTLQLTPASAITTGNRMVVMAGGVEQRRGDDLRRHRQRGQHYTKVASAAASEDTELSVWSAPITAGGGTKPAITVTATGQRRHRRGRARVLRAVDRRRRRGGRPVQDRDRHVRAPPGSSPPGRPPR